MHLENDSRERQNPFVDRRFRIHNRMTSDTLGPFTWQELVDLARSGNLHLESRIAFVETPERLMKVADTPLVFELPLSVEDHSCEPIVKKPFKLSHRTRDYLWLLLLGNLLIAAMFYGIAINAMSLMFLLALAVIYNTALAWIIFGILRPY